MSAPPRLFSAKPSRAAWLRISVIAALLAGFALSPKLWLSSRFYPLTPVGPWIGPSPAPVDSILFAALIALVIAAGVIPRREIWIALFVLLAWIALQDQSRWQPWFYQYVLMLAAIALAGSKCPPGALNTCCLIVAATYIWSGLSKVNPVFVDKTFPWLMQPFTRFLPATAQPLVDHLALAAPAFEVAAGIGLLTRRFRAAALIGAIGMHVFILAALGPLGRGFNAVVWPWNLAMMAFLLILFFRRADDPAPLEIIWGRAFAFQKIVLVLFAAMPLFSLFDLWDHYLSSALYSGNIGSAAIYLNDAVFDRLPDVVEDYIYEEGPNLNRLDILDWSLGEMNVPSYPETRVFQSVARKICSYASGDPSIELVVQRKLALLRGKRRFVYHCADLVK